MIGIVPAVLTAALGYLQGAKSTDSHKADAELISRRISYAQSANPNFKELKYPNWGISLMCPRSWVTEDGPARLAGGEFNLVQRYEDTKGAIGINFRLRPVQPNYVTDLAAQIKNQTDTFEKTYGQIAVSDVSVSGFSGKLFAYEAPTGELKMTVKQYWIRLVPDVQLQIMCATRKGAKDEQEFWRDADQVVASLIIAFDSWQARDKASAKNN